MKRPNIVVFMTDQQNATTIGKNGSAITPNIDRFLKKSLHLTDTYCPAPHCCPCRATFFTGLYPSQHGVWNNVEVDNSLSRDVFDGVKMFPEALRDAGYNTIFSGKWHVSGFDGPEDRGFDQVVHEFIQNYGRIERGHYQVSKDWDHVYNNSANIDGPNEENQFGRIIREGYPHYSQIGESENPFGDTDTVTKAIDAINKYESDSPFFMYIGTVGPHDPYIPPKEYLDLYDINKIELPESFHDDLKDKPALYRRTKEIFDLEEAEHKESVRRYLAFCSYEDALFGKVIKAVKDKGIYEDTVIIYLSDHGDYMGAHGLWGKGLMCFDEVYRIPSIIGGGYISQSGVLDDFVSMADFAPTILEIAGVETEIPYIGRSLMPLIQGKKPDDWRNHMFTQTNGNEVYGVQRSVFNKEYKYTFNAFDYDELYDLKHDPHEMHNLIEDKTYQPIVKQMCKQMWGFARAIGDGTTCPYILTALAPYGPGVVLEDS